MRTRTLHERFFRHIWSRQYVQHSALRTTDGLEVRVFSVGTLNIAGGPDFRDAVLKIGGITYCGDIEIHRTLIDWLRHHHEQDPRYNNVVLHVVLEQPTEPLLTRVSSGRSIPLLVLEVFLSESIHSIWEKTILAERLRARQDLRCREQNSSVRAEVLVGWIHRLTLERLELKLRRFDERLRELAQIQLLAVHDRGGELGRWRVQGDADDIPPPHRDLTPQQLSKRELWDQVLYEGLMDGLGYSRNREPFARLARAMTLRTIHHLGVDEDEEALQAVLLGAAGLLPAIRSVKDKSSRDFVRRLSKIWKERRSQYKSTVLRSADWQLFPTRPGNFPTVRMSAASALIRKIHSEDLFRALVEKIKSAESAVKSLQSVRSLLSFTPHPFWTHHYAFDESTAAHVHPLGPERRDEIITNTVVPLALLYARIFKDRSAREKTLGLYSAIPSAATNSVIRLMHDQLVRDKLSLAAASVQQGLLQLYKFYCCEGLCAECEIDAALSRRDQ
jgi:hypothetical protein